MQSTGVHFQLTDSSTDIRKKIGFEEVMNEERGFPRLMPRAGKNITVIIGEPMNDAIEPLLEVYHEKFPTPWRPLTYDHDVAEDIFDEPNELRIPHLFSQFLPLTLFTLLSSL